MTPGNVMFHLKQHLKREWFICFLTTVIVGLIAHMYKLVNTLPNWDSLLNVYSDQNTIHLGRCFLTIACGISSYYDLPWLNGLLSLCYLGISSAILSEIFEVKKKAVLILMSSLVVTFPTVTSTFAYMYTADGYFLGMLCMTLAIYFTLHYNRGWLCGLFLMAFGYGCYQAYITWALLLVLFWSISQLLFTQFPLSVLFQKWSHFLLCGILGTILYWICNKILIAFQGISLASYQGIGEAGLSSFHPLHAFKQCIIDFFYFFIGPLSRMNLYSYLNIIILVLMLVFFIHRVYTHKLYNNPSRLILILLLATAVPFAAFVIYFISPQINYHMLMLMSLCLIYIFFLLFYEKSSSDDFPIKQWSILLVTGLTIYSFIVIANISYHTMQQSYNKSIGVILRLADRIEQTDKGVNCAKIAVIGRLPESDALSVNLPPDMTGIIDGYIMSTPVHYQAMLSEYCNLNYSLPTEEEQAMLIANESVAAMPVWPHEGCVSIIDDILVIHMGIEEKIN